MSNYNESLIDKENNNKIEPFDKIEQNPKRYIPNIPSVITDMKKNNIYINNDESSQKIKENDNNNNNVTNSLKEENLKINEENSKEIFQSSNDNTNYLKTMNNYWNTFTNNKTVSTIINPFQDDGECVNKVYKIYSCITITLILIVILLSITLS